MVSDSRAMFEGFYSQGFTATEIQVALDEATGARPSQLRGFRNAGRFGVEALARGERSRSIVSQRVV
jgi:hypothetical protein